jgi:hypothetical protein
MINLEERGAIENRFHEKFRRREPWSVDWSTSPEKAAAVRDEKEAD